MTIDGSHDHPTPQTPGGGAATAGPIPEAESIEAESIEAVDLGTLMPSPEGPAPANPGLGRLPERPERPELQPLPVPRCTVNLKAGCYRITFQPSPSALVTYRGTMRVEASGSNKTISGDLYRFRNIVPPSAFTMSADGDTDDSGTDGDVHRLSAISTAQLAELAGAGLLSPRPLGIPIYARRLYYSYLKVTGISQTPAFAPTPCQLTLTAQEHVYTQPPAGSFNGSFPADPGTRTVRIVLEEKSPAPAGFVGPYFEGRLYQAGVDKGVVTMGWVSNSFRRATLEIDTLTGAVAPLPVGAEDFRSVFATAGWNLSVVSDQVNIPVPAGVNANDCWSSGNLHNLMAGVRNPSTDLDKEWRLHLIVVPGRLGCGRGVMYDQIVVPREGVASFCNDGYPSTDTSNYGAAANQQQRNIPRAFLRSACHEVGHGFNQIHQEGEGGADNSIMTTTPSVANVLGGPASGAPGVFPTNINLAFNTHVRRHLIHWPDPVVRPGGHTFNSGHGGAAIPSADLQRFGADELDLRLNLSGSVELGEPLQLQWTLTNTSAAPIAVPSDLGLGAQHATLSVTGPDGRSRPMPSFVICTDGVSIEPLAPDAALSAETRLFWSTNGFAFATPGKHRVELRVAWVQAGVAFGVEASADVWVGYPQSTTDNDAAALLLDDQVGMYVALGGDAPHLGAAVSRILDVVALGDAGDGSADRAMAGPRALRGFAGLLPAEPTVDLTTTDRETHRSAADTGNGTEAAENTKARSKAPA